MAGEAGGVPKAIAIEKRGGLEETAPKETVYPCQPAKPLHMRFQCGLTHLGPMASRAAIATTYTVACGADENMEH
jgi:hypothetical protein